MKLSYAELSTVLAALRLFQDQPEATRGEDNDLFMDVEPLTDDQIDALCERLNVETLAE